MKLRKAIILSKIVLIGLILQLLSMNIALGQDRSFSWELSGIASIFGTDTRKNGLNTTIYLDPLKYANGPIAERYFLSPTDAIGWSGFYENISNPILGYESSGLESRFSYTRVIGDHVLTPRFFYIDFDSVTSFGTGLNYSHIIREGTHAYVNIGVANEDISEGSSSTSTFDIGYRKLWRYDSGKSLATDIQLGYTRAKNESRSFSILELDTRIDYYFGHRWGVGIGLRLAGSEIQDQHSFGLDLSTEYFFTTKFSVNFEANLVDYLPRSSAVISATKYFH